MVPTPKRKHHIIIHYFYLIMYLSIYLFSWEGSPILLQTLSRTFVCRGANPERSHPFPRRAADRPRHALLPLLQLQRRFRAPTARLRTESEPHGLTLPPSRRQWEALRGTWKINFLKGLDAQKAVGPEVRREGKSSR